MNRRKPQPTGPYRQVQVLPDGKVAGIAAPYPHIHTGGWSNPVLWDAQPAPRAFDIQSIRYDLTPFTGLLTGDRPHRITVRVAGVPSGQSGWDTPVNVLAWQDVSGRRVTGGLLSYALSALDHTSVVTADGAGQRIETVGTCGWRSPAGSPPSRGHVLVTVTESLTGKNARTWGAGENPDRLAGVWTDTSTVAVAGPSVSSEACLRMG